MLPARILFWNPPPYSEALTICSSLELPSRSASCLCFEDKFCLVLFRPMVTKGCEYWSVLPLILLLLLLLLFPLLELSHREVEKRGLMLAALTAKIPTNCNVETN